MLLFRPLWSGPADRPTPNAFRISFASNVKISNNIPKTYPLPHSGLTNIYVLFNWVLSFLKHPSHPGSKTPDPSPCTPDLVPNYEDRCANSSNYRTPSRLL